MSDDTDGEGYSALAVAVSALAGLAVTAISYFLVQAQAARFHEILYRVQPTIENRGVGSDWVGGNTDPVLDAMIALVHAADVIMGLFILVMVFVHWASFRRLASRMRRPGDTERRATVADGGRDAGDGREGDAPGGGDGG